MLRFEFVCLPLIIHRETNLKCRQPLPETGELGDDEEQLAQVKSMFATFLLPACLIARKEIPCCSKGR